MLIKIGREIKKRGGRRKEKSRRTNRKKRRLKTKTKIQRIRKQLQYYNNKVNNNKRDTTQYTLLDIKTNKEMLSVIFLSQQQKILKSFVVYGWYLCK